MTQALAATFHALHADGLLLLANAWDAGSARLASSAGARAIATSSAAVAWAHGWPDGDAVPTELMLQTVAEIVGAVHVPVTVDIEGGYSDDPDRVAGLVLSLLDAGAVGINVEDGARDVGLAAQKIAAARRAAGLRGVDLFINARTDVYLRGLVAPPQRVSEVIVRETRYREAGASGLFVPGITDPDDIAAVAAAVMLPLNVMARPGMVDQATLQALGVRRYSAGSAIAEAVQGLTLAMMREFTSTGRVDTFGVKAMPYADLNAVMKR